MFDWYIPAPDLYCSGCGRPLREWQGKQGPCALFVWRQGERNPVDQIADDGTKLPPEGLARWRLAERFVIYCYCTCGRRVEAEGTCEGETWTRTRLAFDAV